MLGEPSMNEKLCRLKRWVAKGKGLRKKTPTTIRTQGAAVDWGASQRVLYTPPTQEASDQHACKRSGAGLQAEHPNSPSPPGSMSESVRCVNEKLAMLAGEMENLEYGTAWGQLCSALRGGGGGGEKYFDVCREGLELRRLLVVFDMKGSGEKSSSHSKPPPTSTKQDITLLWWFTTQNTQQTHSCALQVSKHRSGPQLAELLPCPRGHLKQYLMSSAKSLRDLQCALFSFFKTRLPSKIPSSSVELSEFMHLPRQGEPDDGAGLPRSGPRASAPQCPSSLVGVSWKAKQKPISKRQLPEPTGVCRHRPQCIWLTG